MLLLRPKEPGCSQICREYGTIGLGKVNPGFFSGFFSGPLCKIPAYISLCLYRDPQNASWSVLEGLESDFSSAEDSQEQGKSFETGANGETSVG